MTPMNINSGNRSVSNHLIPYNAMNINTITNSMLGKRKADKTIYERAKKRKDLTMIAEVGRKVITQAEYVNIGMNHILTNLIDNKFDLSQKLQGKKK